MSCDLKLSGGRVIDGTGAPGYTADVAVTGDRITAVGDLSGLEAAETLDCMGRTIAPGFIDIHSHSDWLLPGHDHGALVEPFIRQGMTTLIGGNCGFSPAPVTDLNRDAACEASQLIRDDRIDLRWETMDGFLTALADDGVSLNVGQLAGHGAIRSAVTGALNPAAPTSDELAQMETHAREALDAGCLGISTGLGYPPGIFSREDELAAFAGWAARENKLFTSHLKAYSWISPVYDTDANERPHNIEAIKEILRVAEAGKARVQISHLIFVGRRTWHTYQDAIRVIEDARDAGIDAAFDAFPYTAGNTTCQVIFPPHVLPRLEEALMDPEERAGLRSVIMESMAAVIGLGIDDIQIMNCNVPDLNQYNGMRVFDAAGAAGMDPWDFYCEMTVRSKRNARILIHTYSGDGPEEEPLRAVLAHPLCTFETDTFLTADGHQNPASYGTFPRALSTYVEQGLFTLEEAVRKMTGAAAERLGWTDRGWVREGSAADLVVLNLDTLQDTATFENPASFPAGIEHVFINGRHVIDGEHYDAAAAAGRVLRQ